MTATTYSADEDGIIFNININKCHEHTHHAPCGAAARVKWTLGPVQSVPANFVIPRGTANTTHKQRSADMALILTDVQKVTLSVSFVDAKGNPATVDGAPVWSVSDANVLSVTAAADGLSADVLTVGPLGTAQVSVTADADLGEGVKSLVGTLDVQVVGSEAVAIAITAGVPAVI